MRLLHGIACLALGVALSAWQSDEKPIKVKKEEEPPTQALEVLKDPPAAVVAETQRLAFRVTPLYRQGLLSRQVRDGLKWLLSQERGGIVKLRAFVAGTGDMRRVPAIVSEIFTEKRLSLPAVTVLQVGDLPAEGAQVVMESEAVARKVVNPHGLAFISGQAGAVEEPLQPLGPLAEKAVARVRAAVTAAGAQSSDVLRVTCFLSLLEELPAVRQIVATEFPGAAMNFVQRVREPMQSLVECEAVARLRSEPKAPIEFVNAPELPRDGGRSQVALVGARRLALTGSQLAFGLEPADARLAFDRLGKTLEQAGASYKTLVMARFYPLSRTIGEQARKVGAEFFPREQPPACTVLPAQGLPSLDASFGVDAIAVVPDSR